LEVIRVPQLHLYVNEKTAEYIKKKAAARGMGVSGYLAELVKRDVAIGWPDEFFLNVAGGWKGKPLERAAQGTPEDRDKLSCSS
jgi:hypothetical protein